MSEWPSWVNVARDVHDMTSDPRGEPRWPSGPDAERELAAALRSQIWGEGAQSGLNRLEDARAILAALQEKRDPGE